MEWSLKHDAFRTAMLRFIDVFPSLSAPSLFAGHLAEYFDAREGYVPPVLRFAARLGAHGGRLGNAFLHRAARYGIEKLGKQFILGEDAGDAARGLAKVRGQACAFSVDLLGEAVVSEDEAEEYGALYMTLLNDLGAGQRAWQPLRGPAAPGGQGGLDWGFAPKISISLKPTSLYSQATPQAFEDSVAAMLRRIRPVYEKVIEVGGALCIDMESFPYKDMSLEIFRRLRSEYRSYPHLGIAMQAYLRETGRDLSLLLDWARHEGLTLAVRLVKGAYWDYEVLRARQNGWEMPVYTDKAETDAAFERHVRLLLRNHEIAYLACASHNIRSIAAALASAEEFGVPEDRYEFQVLYGMAEPIRRGLVKIAGRVRLYCPYGRIVPGMAYLVRRLLENTANQGFLRLMFAEGRDAGELLRDPAGEVKKGEDPGPHAQGSADGGERLPPFTNQPPADFTKAEERELFLGAITAVRRGLRKSLPLYLNGSDRFTPDTIPSVNPADPGEVLALVCQAGRPEAREAVEAAQRAFEGWRETGGRERAAYLVKAAAWMRGRRHELAAWQVLEIGKQWDQASADVAEAIDFLEYYAREMIRLATPQKLPSPPGEVNHYFYEPRGVAVVIAPWNFPLAISAGMVSAAIVTGNCVVYKPSPLTPVIGHHLVEAFCHALLPAGVFNFLPGPTEEVAEYLIGHPGVSTIAFTGSTQVGLKIIEKAAVVRPGQMSVKRVICEMGGKNAIIIDEDADLDEAVPAVLLSAFGFQGQKCSSCSRVIVLESIYENFTARLVRAAGSLSLGPAEDPASFMGPVADQGAQARIQNYIDLARQEGRVLYSGVSPKGQNYVPLTVVGEIRPEHRLAQEEIFGPVLAVMKARTFEEALQWANSTSFALTGGVFSRSPRHLEEARRSFLVGNLYLNRPITGALVGRQPFGGSRMSGLGTKAGGPEYLLHFMDPRVVTENTARRGFAPDVR
jgi:RHH-type proline utilization regulon transcriptional repressor/proline dehydrogenase/delta 1-pyrroline-5-carboxylate dehydrogenase